MAICRVVLGPSGPFKKAPGGLTHMLITVVKFTMWIEAKPLAKIGSKQALNFI
jgi:hypothetical protein